MALFRLDLFTSEQPTLNVYFLFQQPCLSKPPYPSSTSPFSEATYLQNEHLQNSKSTSTRHTSTATHSAHAKANPAANNDSSWSHNKAFYVFLICLCVFLFVVTAVIEYRKWAKKRKVKAEANRIKKEAVDTDLERRCTSSERSSGSEEGGNGVSGGERLDRASTV
ncbi:hypothetical protein B0J14DRAFT_607744 [Halenospora varia]|nr:hypothetical protein B0J14DRAFT_607744 [Halenospora varia]